MSLMKETAAKGEGLRDGRQTDCQVTIHTITPLTQSIR